MKTTFTKKPYYTEAKWFMGNFMQLANIQYALFFLTELVWVW